MAARKNSRRRTGNPPSQEVVPEAQRAEPQPGAATAAGESGDAAPASFPVVGIAASAGGLEAFKKFFNAMPADSGVAFVLIPHLAPTHESLMVELLGRTTAMPVAEAGEGMAVEADHVYVIPPNKYMGISGGRLRLSDPVDRPDVHTSIDLFLRALAEDQREKAVCIILSGTGTHGTLGLKAVKDRGGVAMVQDPATAAFDRMPLSAVATGLADYVLAPEQMPAALTRYVRHFYVNGGPRAEALAENTDQLQQILAQLQAHTRYDFRCYRKPMLARRIERRMGLTHVEDLTAYLAILREDPDEVKQLARDLLISVTSFFRDPDAFRVLETEVAPALVRAKGPDEPVRVWVAGCATGEEAYSVAVVFLEQLAAAHSVSPLQVFASDLDDRVLDFARHATYPEGVAVDIAPDRLARYFLHTDDYFYQVKKPLREAVVFARQNLLGDAPFSKLDLISCRNLLIYFEPEVQQKIIALFHFALNEGGYLFLGPSENVGQKSPLFEPVSKKWRVFRRIGPSRPVRIDLPILAHVGGAPAGPSGPPPVGRANVAEISQRLLLEDYAPAAVLIGERGDVLYFFGPTMRYLDQPTGVPTQDLLALARDGLRTRLRVALHKAVGTKQRVTAAGVRVKRDGGYQTVRIVVRPVQMPRVPEGLFLVTFEDETPPGTPPHAEAAGAADEPLVRQLEEELKSTRDDLQGTIEELETSNEQLKTSNEEIMSMNEELQSANEELETSKEELQSLNEELTTVNAQLHDKVEELEHANNDLANLIGSSDVATVFLGADLRIVRYTAPTTKLLNLIPTDLGRPLADIAPRFSDPGLGHDCEAALRDGSVREKEVQVRGGGWWLRRVLPYRTLAGRIEGVVVTFTDVTTMKLAGERLRRLATVLLDSNDAVTVHDFDGRITSWNRGAAQMYGYTEAEALALNVEQLVPPELVPPTRDATERLRRGEAIPSLETRRVCKDGRVLDVWLTPTTLKDEAGTPLAVATTERDVTEQKRTREQLEQRVRDRTALLEKMNDQLRAEIAERQLAAEALRQSEEALRESRDRLAAILDTAAEGIITLDENGLVDSFNKAAERMFDCAADEVVGRNVNQLMPAPGGPQPDGAPADSFRTEVAGMMGRTREVVGRRKDGSLFPLEVAFSESRDGGGRLFTGVFRDISERRALEKEVLEVATAEHRRIGQDLHDSVGQELTGLGLMAETLLESLTGGPPADVRVAGKIAEGVRRVLGQVRALSRGLIPVEVDGAGLMSALGALAVRVRDQFGTASTFTCPEPVVVEDNTVATHLFHIAQEATVNALKHGRPRRVSLHLEADDRDLTLRVEDDGDGIGDGRAEEKGMGLRIMRYRAGLINAVLHVRPRDGGGTAVVCTVRKGGKQGDE